MSRFVLILLMIFLSLSNYSRSQDFAEVKLHIIHPNSTVVFDKNGSKGSFGIEEGDYTVFEFASDNGGDPGNHSTVESKVVFQVDPTQSEFDIRDADLINFKTIYLQLGHTQDMGVHRIEKGYIKGQKLSNGDWNIEFDLSFIGRHSGKEYRIIESDIYKLL